MAKYSRPIRTPVKGMLLSDLLTNHFQSQHSHVTSATQSRIGFPLKNPVQSSQSIVTRFRSAALSCIQYPYPATDKQMYNKT
jgi:hypothetical protein